MSVHENSRETYKELADHLSGRQLEVYEYVVKHGKSSDRQIKDGLGFDDMNKVRPRVTELVINGLFIEGDNIRDTETGRPVRTVLIDSQCNHDRYRQSDYMMIENAKKAMKAGQICWIGIVVKECETCGADISHAKRVQTKTVDQYMGSL